MKDITPATAGPGPSSARRKWRFSVGMCALAAGTATTGLSLTALAGTASAANRPAATSTSHVTVTVKSVKKYGNVLFDQQGLALYFDTADKPPKFNCTGGCETIWPPLVLQKGQKTAVAGKGVTGLGAIKNSTLKAGEMQVTWKGKPLYTYAADSKGTVNGQGIQGIWFVVQPSAKIKAAANSTATASSSSSGGW